MRNIICFGIFLLGFPVKGYFQDIPSEREEANLTDHKLYINGNLLTEYIIREEETIDHFYVKSTKWFIDERSETALVLARAWLSE
jgi:hypothetical protein